MSLLLMCVEVMLCSDVLSVPQVEADSGEEYVKLPCKTSLDFTLLYNATIEWTNTYNTKVHVYQNGSDQPEEQDKIYKDRTEMNKDLLTSKDLSLTLKYPTDANTGIYTCTVYNSERNILLKRKVELKVRGQCCRYSLDSVKTTAGSSTALVPVKPEPHVFEPSTWYHQ
uniref:Ig-like domain-containing protein n=1 Tax=Oreochromis aureus TaxID=47969 RepID=A0A668TG69_OREAU